MEVLRFQADASVDEVAAALTTNGCAIIDEILDAAAVERVRSELRPYLKLTSTGGNDFSGQETHRAGSIVERSPAARELITHSLVFGVSEKVITEKNKGIQLHVTQLISIGSGETPQPLHRDQWAWNFFPFPEGHEVMVNCMWAMTDFTSENGATRVVPSSGRYEGRETPPAEEVEIAAMKAGSVCLFTGSCFHAGGPNVTGENRDGLIIAYCANWLRQEENQYLSVSRETALTLDEPLQRLLGYDQLYSLGYWGDQQHPLEYLGGATSQDDRRTL